MQFRPLTAPKRFWYRILELALRAKKRSMLAPSYQQAQSFKEMCRSTSKSSDVELLLQNAASRCAR